MFEFYSSPSGREEVKEAWFPISANIAVGAGFRRSANGTVAAVGASAASFMGFTKQVQPAPSDGTVPVEQIPGANGTLALGTQARISGHRHNPGDKYRVAFSIEDADLVTATAGGANTITAAAIDNGWDGGYVFIVSGPGAGQVYGINGSAANVITVNTNWTTQPNAGGGTSKFIVIPPQFYTALRTEATGLKMLGQAVADVGGNGFKVEEIRLQKPNGSEDQLTPPGSGARGRPGWQEASFDFAAAGSTSLGPTTTPIIYAVVEPMLPF